VVEHRPYKPGVAGSKPAPPTNEIRYLRDRHFLLDRLVPVLVPVVKPLSIESIGRQEGQDKHEIPPIRQVLMVRAVRGSSESWEKAGLEASG
jgi:hypothetical protein